MFLYQKKGNLQLCDNWRGISLLSVAGKVFARILANRIAPIAESVLDESQCGFRKCRGTIDMIFVARQLQEKAREQMCQLYMCFVDLMILYLEMPCGCYCKERSQPVGTDSSRHNIIISTPNTNQWSLFIVTLQTTLMDRQSAHLMTRVQRLLTCAVTDYYTTPSSRRSVSIGWSSCSLGIPVLYFCRLISMGSLIFCRFFMW